MPTYRVVGEYQPRIDQERFGRLRDLFDSYSVRWTPRFKPDGTGNVVEADVSDYGGAAHIEDGLIKLGYKVTITKV
jgi:hypothetical protein